MVADKQLNSKLCMMVYLVEGFGKIQSTKINRVAISSQLLDFLMNSKYNMMSNVFEFYFKVLDGE
jgi:hypothetical protein